MSNPTLPATGPYVCQFDQTQHQTIEDLHSYLRRFRLTQEKYYTEYYPRKDLFDGSPIAFKNFDNYFSKDFSTKNNWKKWAAKSPQDAAEWAKNWLVKRKERKGLVYAPSETELVTLDGPTVAYYNEAFAAKGGYEAIATEIGLTPRYKNKRPDIPTILPPKFRVLVDTREKTPVKFHVPWDKETINVGDYALSYPNDVGVRVERKSVSDFFGTLSEAKIERKDGVDDFAFSRFDRELQRAKDANLYVVMVVEASLSDIKAVPYLPHYRNIKTKPDYVLGNLRILLHKYPLNFQCLFVNGRGQMEGAIVGIFQMGEQVKTCDLQYFYNLKNNVDRRK